jgi:hypothetical protein
MHQLSIQDSAGDIVLVPLQHDRITIGRQRGNVVRLTDQNVSRRHARLLREGGEYFIEDLTSYLGTLVNGVRISERRALKDGDSVTIGDYCLTMQVRSAVISGRTSSQLRPPVRPRRRPLVVAGQLAARVSAGLEAPRRWWTTTVKALTPAGVASLASWFKESLATDAGAPLAVGLPMVAAGGSPPPPRGGGSGPGPGPGNEGVSSSDFSLVQPLPLARQMRLRATLGLAALAAIMITAGVLLAPLIREMNRSPAAPPKPGLPGSPVGGGETAEHLLLEAEAAVGKQQWAEAAVLQARLAAVAPGLPRAEELGRSIRKERENQASLAAAERALGLEDYSLVLTRVAAIPRDSVYRDRARILGQTARSNLVAQHLRAAQSRQNEGDCVQAKKEAVAALALESDNPTGRDIMAQCARVAMAPRGRLTRVMTASRSAARTPAVTEPRQSGEPRAPAERPDFVAAPPAPPSLFMAPAEKPSRRPIEPKNPYAADLP